MLHANAILADDEVIAAVRQALAQRHPNSRRRGRPDFYAEVVLRLLVLKHHLGPAVIQQIHERILQIAQSGGLCKGARRASTPQWLKATFTTRRTVLC
jgi:hypothetical protein